MKPSPAEERPAPAEPTSPLDDAVPLEALRRGDRAAAPALYARFPRGQTAESAKVERVRVLASVDPAGAASAARLYLARHPRGFARAEAAELAADSP